MYVILDFQVVDKKNMGFFFWKINNDIVVCYDGKADPKGCCF